MKIFGKLIGIAIIFMLIYLESRSTIWATVGAYATVTFWAGVEEICNAIRKAK